MNNLCFFHDDLDGIFSAAVHFYAHDKHIADHYQYYPISYEKRVQEECIKLMRQDYIKKIVLLDYCMKLPEDVARKVVLIVDHHETTNPEEFRFSETTKVIFDTNYCAAVLTAQNYELDIDRLRLVDIWDRHVKSNMQAFNRATKLNDMITSLPMNQATVEYLASILDSGAIPPLDLPSSLVALKSKEMRNQEVEAVHTTQRYDEKTGTAYFLNTGAMHVVGALAAKTPEADVVVECHYATKLVHIRSKRNDISIIAKQHGGGGHPKAAGFSVDSHEELMRIYYHGLEGL